MPFGRQNIAKLSDHDLLQQYRSKHDGKLVGELYKRYAHLVLGVCLKYLRNEEESKDAVIRIFEKLLEDLKTHEVQAFKPWVHTVTRNFCLMHLRKHQKQWRNEESIDQVHTLAHEGDEIEQKTLQEAQLEKLEEGINALKEEQKVCVQLFYLQRKSYQEVANTTGFELKHVKSHIQNGKRNLRIWLTQYDEFG